MAERVLDIAVGWRAGYEPTTGKVDLSLPDSGTQPQKAITKVAVATRTKTRGGGEDSCWARAPPSTTGAHNTTRERSVLHKLWPKQCLWQWRGTALAAAGAVM
jgi:hypothetical protein